MENKHKILFKLNSHLHDWSDGAVLKSLVCGLKKLGLVDHAAWFADENDKKTAGSFDLNATFVNTLITANTSAEGRREFTFGIDGPQSWEFFWNTFPDHLDHGILGINTAWFTITLKESECISLSPKLVSIFKDIVTDDVAEYGCIHLYDHWIDMTDELYETPLTIAPMFQGVYWCNYVGGSELQKFDPIKIAAIDFPDDAIVNDTSVYFTVGSNIIEAASDEGEMALVAMTEKFRDALKPEAS